MGKKLGLHSIFFRSAKDHKPRYSSSSFPFSSSPPSWTWSSCRNPRTHSFRNAGDNVCKTANSIYFDSSESFPAFSEEEVASFSTMSASDESPTAEPMESFIRGLRSSGRLFFEPGSTSPSIMEEAGVPFKESVVLAMESLDPYSDFRVSMEEMVAAHGMNDWVCLLQLLHWYLRANGKKTHCFIFGAFVSLLVSLASSSSTSSPSLEIKEGHF